jgi:hypothetical protein
MSYATVTHTSQSPDGTDDYQSEISFLDYPWLLLGAVAVELLTPLLISKGILPGAARFLSDVAMLVMLAQVLLRMLAFNRIPRVVFLIAAITAIGVVAATFEDQQKAATVWGWWLLFRFPLIGIYAYLQPVWPKRMAEWFVRGAIYLLAFEVAIQIGQYLTGEPVGDQLAGTFGAFGTANLAMYIILVLALALGEWLAFNRWQTLVVVLMMGGLSSVLGEMKLFPFAVVLLALTSMVIYLANGGKVHRVFVYVLVLAAALVAFGMVYNVLVADAMGSPRIEEYLNFNKADSYLSQTFSNNANSYYLGRIFSMQYGWETIQRDLATLLFGMGIGARSESVTLGIVGSALQQGYYGLSSGTSLLVLMQEVGLVGIALFLIFVAGLAVRLYRDARRYALSYATVVRYGLILFSIGWPLWIWYGFLWNSPAMLLYWAAVGYALSDLADGNERPMERAAPRSVENEYTWSEFIDERQF